MRMSVSTLYMPAMALCCLLAARVTISSADDAPGPASAANSIPNMICTPFPRQQGQTPPSHWNDCVGTYIYGDGNVYRGEFRHGNRDGFGALEIKFTGQSSDTMIGWDGPAIYVGSFKDDRLNGYGLLIAKSGDSYAGTFKDNIAQSDLTRKQCSKEGSADWTNCIGTFRFPDGNVYRGEFVHGLPEGIGMLQVNDVGGPEATQVELPLPGVYVGQFKDGEVSGQGTVVMSGAGYFGTFSDNTFMPGTVDKPGS